MFSTSCSRRVSAIVLIAGLFLAIPLAGQTGLGVVRGTVQDSSKAVIPNAKVTLSNSATGSLRASDTNSAGIYYFGNVPVGPYTIAVEAAGFRKWSGTLTLEAGQTAVIDPALEVGSLESTVEVTGVAPVITTEGGAVSDVKDALRIHNLPLNGRQITNLFDLTPGVEGGGNPRVNGMKVGSTDMLLDGISYVDRFGGGISRVQPGLDTIQEYRIETAGSSAQYSRPATVELVTRSGTNEIHGAAFETHRNNAGGLRARQRQDGNTSAKLIRNEYGFWAGGPVIRNKTFWFVDWENLKQRQSNFAIASVPTPEMWDGDLSNAIDTSGNAITIYDPLTTAADGTRTPFLGNKIPTGRISEFARTMQSVSPTPTGAGNPWLEPNFQAYYPRTLDTKTLTLKGDHVFSEKDTLSGRYTGSSTSNKLFGGRYGYPKVGSTDAGGTGRQDANVYSNYARWNHVFKPTFLNEFQASGHRSSNGSGTLADDTPWANKLGLPNPFGTTGWPTICMSDYVFFYYGCWDADNRGDQQLTAFQIDDNVTWIKGKHSIKFGFKGRQEYNNVRELQQAQGSHSLYSDWTAQFDPANQSQTSYTGSGFGSTLLGLPTYLSNQYNRGYFYFRQKEFGLYVQDSWKVTPRLTLDLGLRWDMWTPYNEKYNRLVNLDLNNYLGKMEVISPHSTKLEDIPGIPPAVLESWKQRGVTWVTADSIGFPGALVPMNKKDFGPRIGAAFRLSDKWVLRAGYGVYYWPMPLSQILQSARTNPPLNLRFVNSLADKNGTVDFYALSHAPAPTDYVGGAIVDINTIGGIGRNAQAFMPWDVNNWADDRMQTWTFTIEREVMRNTALRLSYIGNHGSNLEQRWRWNDAESEYNYQARTGLATNSSSSSVDARRPNPNWSSGCCASPVKHNGFSNTHSGQVELERRFSGGLAFQFFYTYAHAMTTSDTGGFDYGASSINSNVGGAFAVPEPVVVLGEPNLTEDQRLRLGYYNSSEVPPHRLRWNGIYELPFGRGKKFGGSVSKPVNLLVGGWQLAFIGTYQSGNWSSVSSGRYLFGDPTLSSDEQLTMNIFGRTRRLYFRGDFDPTFATNVDATKLQQLVPVDRSQRILRPLGPNFDNRIPQQLADGSVRSTTVSDMVNWNARNFFLGPRQWNEDLSVFKYFDITERVKTRFTADFFNFFNHPNNFRPDQTTGLQDLSRQVNDPRIIQFSLRVEW
jgi:hypothetical protein